jgi:hypothetical protein
MSGRPRALRHLQRDCDQFNAACPVGSVVNVRKDDGSTLETTTRSAAEVLSGRTPVVWLDGISGCYALDRVSPAEQVSA